MDIAAKKETNNASAWIFTARRTEMVEHPIYGA